MGKNTLYEVYAYVAVYSDVPMGRKTDIYRVGSDYNVSFENLTAVMPVAPIRIPASALSGILSGALASLAALMTLVF